MYVAHASRSLRLAFAHKGDAPQESLFIDERALAWSEGSGPFSVSLERGADAFVIGREGTTVLEGALNVDDEGPRLSLTGPRGARLFGFGAASGTLEKGQQQFELMTRDTLFYELEGTSYTAFPFALFVHGEAALGVLLDSTYPARVSTRANELDVRYLSANEPAALASLVVISGTIAEVLDEYTQLTGRPFFPPLWSLGFHQCRWSYKTQQKVLEVARRFRAEDLPCDAIYLDIHYMDAFRVFTWNKKGFPAPKRLHEELRAEGIRTVAIVDPGVSKASYPAYDDGKAQDLFCKTSTGEDYTGRVWPGDTVFPDFTREDAREYWARHHATLFDAGVSGIWNDMNDPVLKVGKVYDPLAEDLVHARGSHRRLRNLYADLQAEATWRAFALHRPEERPFLLTRSGFSGIQKRAAVWTGDNYTSWSQLRENLAHVLSLGLTGVPFSGADIGGFGGRRGRLGVFKLRVDRELFARWMELGAFMPFCRVHTVLYSPSQEPWSYGEKVLAVSRRVLRRRYRLLPLFYALFREAHERGMPVVRPLFLHEASAPHDACQDQFFVGSDVLVAPVLARRQTTREVWLPAGAWWCVDTLELCEGPARVTRPCPLGAPPVFVREGAVLPLFADARNSDDALEGPLRLEVYAGPRESELSGRLYLDDGKTSAHERGAFLDVRLSGRSDERGLELELTRIHDGFAPPQDAFELRLLSEPAAVLVDGTELQVTRRDLADEDREGSVFVARVSLSARRVTCRWA